MSLFIIAAAFLLGSLPFGVLFGRWVGGVDPRTRGSRNIGFTNVLRVAGRLPAFCTLIGDIGKGILAIRLAQWMIAEPSWQLWCIGFFAVLGHNYSVFLKFRGGKGVATGLGVAWALEPLIGGWLVLIWFVTVGIWRYSSLGAITAFALFPVLCAVFVKIPYAVVFSALISAIILYKHLENIARLLAGTESKMGHS